MGTKLQPGKFDCYKHADENEPVFVLLGRDAHAEAAVRFWAHLRSAQIFLGRYPESDREKVEEALKVADAMESYRLMLGKP